MKILKILLLVTYIDHLTVTRKYILANWLDDLMHKHSNKSIYITGDLNLNLLDYDHNVIEFFDKALEYNLLPLLNKPTRITNNTLSLIDHVLITNTNNIRKQSEKIIIFKRGITDDSVNYYVELIQNTDWDFVKYTNCTNTAYNLFISKNLHFIQ